MSPRFSQEIFDLFIESIAQPRKIAAVWPLLNVGNYEDGDSWTPRGTTTADLRTCALVCESWNATAVKHLWSYVYVDSDKRDRSEELLRMFSTKPRVLAAVNFVSVRLSVWDNTRNSDPCFLALCVVLAPTPCFRLQEPMIMEGDDDDEYHWRGDLNAARAIHSFCHSERITALYYAAPSFPLRLLEHMPNLRDISLSGGVENMIELDVSHNPFRLLAHRLSLRLKRAHFLNSDDVLKVLVALAPHILSELEEIRFHPPYISQEYHVEFGEFDDVFASALSVAKGSLKRIVLGRGDPLHGTVIPNTLYLQATNSRWIFHQVINHGRENLGLRVGDFGRLTHLTFHGDIVRELGTSEDCWDVLKAILETGGSLPRTLIYLEVVLRGFPLFKLKDTIDVNHVGWEMMRKYLAPSCLPNFQEFRLRGTWVYDEYGDVDQAQHDGNQHVALAISSMFLHSFPSWEGDRRGVKYWCNFVPHYE